MLFVMREKKCVCICVLCVDEWIINFTDFRRSDSLIDHILLRDTSLHNRKTKIRNFTFSRLWYLRAWVNTHPHKESRLERVTKQAIINEYMEHSHTSNARRLKENKHTERRFYRYQLKSFLTSTRILLVCRSRWRMGGVREWSQAIPRAVVIANLQICCQVSSFLRYCRRFPSGQYSVTIHKQFGWRLAPKNNNIFGWWISLKKYRIRLIDILIKVKQSYYQLTTRVSEFETSSYLISPTSSSNWWIFFFISSEFFAFIFRILIATGVPWK